MFSGIIEHALPLAAAIRSSGGMRLGFALPAQYLASVKLGDSIAINGCCLTVCALEGGKAFFDAIPETLSLTNLGTLQQGSIVNLERALLAGSRLDGHMVQGHVDGVGKIANIAPSGAEVRLTIDCGKVFASQCVLKGSVCIDGISLTIAGLSDSTLTVAIIPHTWKVTNLQSRKVGESVNLEADMLGKYVRAHLERMFGAEAGAKGDAALMASIKKHGFA